jgi:hypothetical protein
MSLGLNMYCRQSNWLFVLGAVAGCGGDSPTPGVEDMKAKAEDSLHAAALLSSPQSRHDAYVADSLLHLHQLRVHNDTAHLYTVQARLDSAERLLRGKLTTYGALGAAQMHLNWAIVPMSSKDSARKVKLEGALARQQKSVQNYLAKQERADEIKRRTQANSILGVWLHVPRGADEDTDVPLDSIMFRKNGTYSQWLYVTSLKPQQVDGRWSRHGAGYRIQRSGAGDYFVLKEGVLILLDAEGPIRGYRRTRFE